MLGRALGREFPNAERFTRAALDITDAAAVRAALGPDTRVVLNAAADTRVDAAETDPQHVLVNVVAVGALAALCRQLDATLVHVSTDYVFSGKGIRPYREDDPVDPVNAYGRAKLMGERRAFEEGRDVLIVRTTWVFGMGGVNVVDTILKKIARGGSGGSCTSRTREKARGTSSPRRHWRARATRTSSCGRFRRRSSLDRRGAPTGRSSTPHCMSASPASRRVPC